STPLSLHVALPICKGTWGHKSRNQYFVDDPVSVSNRTKVDGVGIGLFEVLAFENFVADRDGFFSRKADDSNGTYAWGCGQGCNSVFIRYKVMGFQDRFCRKVTYFGSEFTGAKIIDCRK